VEIPALSPAKAWNGDQEKLQAWLATPPSERRPRTQRALAAELEVHETTLTDWKRLPGFAEAVAAMVLPIVKCDLSDVLHAQVKEAKKGSLEHAKWLFLVTGLYRPTSTHEVTGAGGGPFTIEIRTVDDRSP
jgi:hypothetical protein